MKLDKQLALAIEMKTCKVMKLKVKTEKAIEPEARREDMSTLSSYQALAHRIAECKSQAILVTIPAVDLTYGTIVEE
eukprot:5803843-Karenia_brevis.AAC.1